MKNKKLLVGIIVVVLVAAAIGGYFWFKPGVKGRIDPNKVYQVGIIAVPSFPDATKGFKEKMTELGYIEGKNIIYNANDYDPKTAKDILQKYIADKVDLIFAYSTGAALDAKAAVQGTQIPVVFALVTIEGNNVVESQRVPGDNITGARFPAPEITAKRFELLREMMPQLKRLYITYDPTYPTAKSVLAALRPEAASAGVTLVEEQISKAEDIVTNLNKRGASENIDIDAILILPETLSQTAVGYGAISKFAATHHIPVVGNIMPQVQQGALFFYAPAVIDGGRGAATLADKVLRGAKAGTLPVVTPESQLVINYKAAQELGIKVPEGLMSRASEIIR